MQSSIALRNQTYKALKDGYYPIVLGGDHSQAIGSLAGYKKMFPQGKVLWLDAHIDANTPDSSPSQNMHGMPLAYLSGMVPYYSQWKCMDMSKDICYFGIRSYEPEEVQLLKDKQVLVFEAQECQADNLDLIEQEIEVYFNQKNRMQYWVSFDIDAVDAQEFRATGTAEEDGLTLDFVESFFSRMAKRTVGMDFTEVNFELSPSAFSRTTDEQTFRQLFELICHSVNEPVLDEEFYEVPGHLEHPLTSISPSNLQGMMLGNNQLSRGFSSTNTQK